MTAPVKGKRFYHARVLDTQAFDGKTPQLYEVTAILNGFVYYRPVYNYGQREALGAPDKCSLLTFPKIVGSEA